MRGLPIIICLVACFQLYCKEKALYEKEPNNSFSTATEIFLKKPISGFMDSRDDLDFYQLTITEDSILSIKLSGMRGVNHAIKVFANDGNPVLKKLIDDNRKSSPENMANLYAKTGSYYICILHGEGDLEKINKEIPYILTITSRSPGTEEKEPNDNILTANEIKLNEEISGYFSPAKNRLFYSKGFLHREEDWFKVRIDLDSEKPSLINISLSEVPSVNSMIYLFDSNQKEIAMADKNTSGQPESLKSIGITKSGDYYIAITTKNYNDNIDTPYNLRVSLSEHDPSSELEVNDSFEQANLIIKNQITGKINNNKDMDFFYYKTNNENGEYRIELDASEDLDLEFTIYNNNREKVAIINNGNKGQQEVHPNIRLTGNFYLAISSKLSAINESNSYTLNIIPRENKGNSEIEPNDTQKQANKINDVIEGFISKKRDVDYYLLDYGKITRKTFLIQGVKGGKIQVSITDPLGNIIQSKNIIDDKMITIKEMIDKNGYIIIKALAENYDNPYRIEIRGTE